MSKTTDILLGFVAGAAVGAAVGILIAPESGEETRKKLNEDFLDIKKDLEKHAEEVMDKVKDLKNSAGDIMDEVSKKAEEVKKNYKG